MSNIQIETQVCFMNDIVKEVRGGHAAPAAFQRPFVWTEKDVLALWTSIVQGYPLGAFLLWRPKGGIVHARKTLGPIELEAEEHASLILDGQNRLVTIAWSMTNPDTKVPSDTPGSSIFGKDKILVVDPYLKTVRFAPKEDIKGMMMPTYHLAGGTSAFFRNNWQSDEDDQHMEWIEHVARMLRESRVVKTTIINATPEEAREAFLHISRAGVPMAQEDFDAALAYQG